MRSSLILIPKLQPFPLFMTPNPTSTHTPAPTLTLVPDPPPGQVGVDLQYAGRGELCQPAVGVGQVHRQEVEDILKKTFA